MRAVGMVLRQRDLRLLLSAGVISLTGDWMLRIGLTYYVYKVTGSTLASAFMLLASFVPQILLSSFASVFVDRWDLRHTMIVTDVLLAVGLLPLLAVHQSGQVWIIYAVTAWGGASSSSSSPPSRHPAAGCRRRAFDQRQRAEQPEQ